jgi:hypothetical protein
LVHGRFKYLKKIGSGAEGDVFKVEDTQDNEIKLYLILNFKLFFQQYLKLFI